MPHYFLPLRNVMNYSAKPNAVVLDCDGVTLSWFTGLVKYMKRKGFDPSPIINAKPNDFIDVNQIFVQSEVDPEEQLKEFHSSIEFSQCELMEPSSKQVLNRIFEDGCHILIVTACGDERKTQQLRTANLHNQYGRIFADIQFVPAHGTKSEKLQEILDKYNVLFYVDDTISYVVESIELGIEAFHYTYELPESRRVYEIDKQCNGDLTSAAKLSASLVPLDSWDEIYALYLAKTIKPSTHRL